MLHVFGDSYTYGFNFKDEADRTSKVWVSHVAKKFGVEYVNHAVPGGSNWRTARILNNMNLKSEDIVIVTLTISERFEFGVSPTYKPPKIKDNRIADLLETHGDVVTKRFFPQLIDRSTDKVAIKFAEIAYSEFYNPEWLIQMNDVMINACMHKLTTSGCKWLMFNTWCNEDSGVEFPVNFRFPDSNLTHIIGTKDYWNPEQHLEVANIIYDEYVRIYG